MNPTRRHMLQGLAALTGASLLAPLGRSQGSAGCVAQAQAVPVPATPRVVFVIEGNGIYTRALMSQRTLAAVQQHALNALPASALTVDGAYGHTSPLTIDAGELASAPALAPLRDRGLERKAMVVLGLSNVIAGGGHSSFQGGLACARGHETTPAGETIDALLARRLAGDTPFDAVRLGVLSPSERLSYTTCAYGPGRPAVMSTNPVDAYRMLFATLGLGNHDPQLARRTASLAFAAADVDATLASLPLANSREREKLTQYRRAIDAAQRRQARLLAMAGAVALPPAPSGRADDPYTAEDALVRFGVQTRLATAALIGGLTNIAVLASGPGGGLSNTYPSVMRTLPGWDPALLTTTRHKLHHQISAPGYYDAIMAITRGHVALVAEMATQLEATPVHGGGNLLDHTAIIFMSDNGEQHHALAREWPLLVVGGRALGLQTDGRTIVYPGLAQPRHRQLSNFWNTLGHATGDRSLNSFGQEGSGRLATGPLPELLVG